MIKVITKGKSFSVVHRQGLVRMWMDSAGRLYTSEGIDSTGRVTLHLQRGTHGKLYKGSLPMYMGIQRFGREMTECWCEVSQ